MLNEAQTFMEISPWLAIFPGLAIAWAVLGFNLLGDRLRDLLYSHCRYLCLSLANLRRNSLLWHLWVICQIYPGIQCRFALAILRETALFAHENLIIGPIQGAQIAIFHSISDTSRGPTPSINPQFSLERYAKTLPFTKPVAERIVEDLRKAGLK